MDKLETAWKSTDVNILKKIKQNNGEEKRGKSEAKKNEKTNGNFSLSLNF